MSWLTSIFDDGGLMPHGFCLVWNPALMWLQAVSDGAIGIAYFSIPFALIYFLTRRRDIGFGLIFQLFAAFILLCGATHFVEIWTLWHPAYVLQGMVKVATATVSVATAFLVWPALSAAIALPSPAMLRLANDTLSREVDERTKVVEALAGEKEFTELLISSSSECMAMIGEDEVVRVWNPAIAAYSGFPAEQVIGRRIFDFRPGMRGTVFEDGIRSALAGHEFLIEDQLVAEETPRSAKRWVDARYSPVRDRDGHVIGCLSFVRDTTLRHEMEDTLRQAQKMEALGQLTGGIAHDFNNYLTAIIGNLDLIGNHAPDLPAAIERWRDGALQASLRAAALTHQLLAFSRRQILAPSAVDANALVLGMSELLRTMLGERIQAETVLGEGLWPIFVDPNQLESALLNLAINARDAMPDGGRLTIQTYNVTLDRPEGDGTETILRGDYVVVSVGDTGHGMSAEIKERAFDPFFTTKPVGEGSGLGLSQVYGIVKQSGGQVRLETEIGVGTVVRLYLPRRSEAAVQESTPAVFSS